MGKMFSKAEYMAKREVLHEVVPLPLPFQMIFLVSSVCNFKCNYCIQSRFDESQILHSDKFMSLDNCKKIVDNLADYISKIGTSRRIKRLSFSGLGETLVHKDLPEMVAYAKKAGIADEIKIFTNGSLLTPELSDELIAAGLDLLGVSMQGITADSYKNVADYTVDFDKFVENIRYFYEHRGNCKVYCKVADIALKGDEECQKFERIFRQISDEVNIEHIALGNGVTDETDELCFFSVMTNERNNFKTCFQPFVMAEVMPSGDIWACGRYGKNGFVTPPIGNILEKSFGDIWNKDEHKQMCLDRLNHNNTGACARCFYCNTMGVSTENLDGHEAEISERLRKENLR